MELKDAKYLDNLLRRANRSVINIDNIDGESIDTLIDRDLIEVVDKRNGVDPYLIKISPRGRDFLATGGFESEVGRYSQEERDKQSQKKEQRRSRIRDIAHLILAALGLIVAFLAWLFG